jgi:hypothetical protein
MATKNNKILEGMADDETSRKSAMLINYRRDSVQVELCNIEFKKQNVGNSVKSKNIRNSLVPTRLRQINSSQWLSFWSLSLVAIQRNVVYRLLSSPIPHRSLLHRIFPEKYPSSLCQICSSVPESAHHLLFYCHPKTIIWKEVIFYYLWPTVEVVDILSAIYSLDFFNVRYSQKSGISADMVILITLANIWKAHFRKLIEGTTFLWPTVMSSIHVAIQQHIQEGQLSSLL